MKNQKLSHGFTLIELMIVVAIIGILAAIAIPQFANLVSKSQEGATKGNLGTIRSALSIYYGDTEGWYPTGSGVGLGMQSLTTSSKYLQSIPNATLPKTTNSNGHASTNSETDGTAVVDANAGWLYDNGGATSGTWGKLSVNCSHQDLRNVGWSTY